ncbi:MAG: hypothetical protein QW751_00035 [Candidatus Aenigmatarchaeota archaeon]|nr:hypothetical protein [Candidatus Aenigmarchaeota archaeon]
MSYLRMYAKGEIKEGNGWAMAKGSGSVRSDDVTIERSLSDDFGGCVDRTTELAYDIHLRTRR